MCFETTVLTIGFSIIFLLSVVTMAKWKMLVIMTMAMIPRQSCQAYNILFFTQFGTHSHVRTVTPAIEALSSRGHNITYLTFHAPTFDDDDVASNVSVLLMHDVGRFLDGHQENVFNSSYSNVREFFRLMRTLTVDACDVFLQDAAFRRLAAAARRKTVAYDVVVMDPALSECGLVLIWLLGSPPLMFYATTNLFAWISLSLDVPTPFAYAPLATRRFSDRMTFSERMSNTLQNLLFWSLRNFVLAPILQWKIRKLFPSLPPILDIGRNASFVFANSFSPALDFPRPLAPFYVEVGGVHCAPGKPLPTDLEQFIEGAGEHGFIYFSFGTYVRSEDMPPKMFQSFVGAFRRISQRVIWTFDANVSDMPSNVRLLRWAPQQDLLAHPNIRLFMTHFGQLSIQEAVYHGVPMVGMPFCNDQFSNMKIAVERGMGESLDYLKYDEDKVYAALTKVLNNESYKENLRRYSALMRDRPMEGLQTIVYWVEYVAKHRGALHLRFESRHQPLYQQFLLDIIGCTLSVSIFVVCIITVLCLHSRKERLKRRLVAKSTIVDICKQEIL